MAFASGKKRAIANYARAFLRRPVHVIGRRERTRRAKQARPDPSPVASNSRRSSTKGSPKSLVEVAHLVSRGRTLSALIALLNTSLFGDRRHKPSTVDLRTVTPTPGLFAKLDGCDVLIIDHLTFRGEWKADVAPI